MLTVGKLCDVLERVDSAEEVGRRLHDSARVERQHERAHLESVQRQKQLTRLDLALSEPHVVAARPIAQADVGELVFHGSEHVTPVRGAARVADVDSQAHSFARSLEGRHEGLRTADERDVDVNRSGQLVEPCDVGRRWHGAERSLAGSKHDGTGVHVLRELEHLAQAGRFGRHAADAVTEQPHRTHADLDVRAFCSCKGKVKAFLQISGSPFACRRPRRSRRPPPRLEPRPPET